MEIVFDEYKIVSYHQELRLAELEKTLRFEENDGKRRACIFLLEEPSEWFPIIKGLENDKTEGPAIRDTARFVCMLLELLVAAGSAPYKGDVL